MNLLIVSKDPVDGFADRVESVVHVPVEQAAPQVIDGRPGVAIGDEQLDRFDAVFLRLPPRNAVFGRVLTEMIEDTRIPVSHTATGFYTMAKKNYLYHVLHQRGVSAPRTVAVATAQAARNVPGQVEFPVVARRLEQLQETERALLDDAEAVQEFAAGIEYEEDVLLFHEYREGDRYRVLVAEDTIIPLQDDGEGWQFQDASQLKYGKPGTEREETAQDAARLIGTPVAEVLLRGGTVYDVHPNPDLAAYTDVSGRDAFKAVINALQGAAP